MSDDLSTIYGPTDEGFVERYYSDIIASKRERAIEAFGSRIDLTDSSVIGQFINSCSYEEALIWQVLENIYYSRYVQYATGKALDDVVYSKNVIRKPGSKSIGTVTFTKEPSYNKRIYIPINTVVSDLDGLYPFVTTEDGLFPLDTELTELELNVESVNIGLDYNVAAGKISKLMLTLMGISSVTNANATYNGSDRESDEELRIRSINLTPGATATESSIINAVLAVDGVSAVNLKEYFTTTSGLSYTTINDITITSMPPCSSIVFVIGATEDNTADIISAIDENRAIGILVYCVESINIPLNIIFEGTYDGTAIALSESIRLVISDILTTFSFGDILTYSTILKNINNISNVLEITALSITIPTLSVTLDALGDYIDMSTPANRDKYLTIDDISINGVVY